jgi:tRNA pseudouridine55 synthase
MLNGLLLIDKPILYTSHDVVDVVRRVLGERCVGHAGTLDPMATGLLVIMVGPSTKLFDALSGDDKSYEGVMTLGFSTTTLDAEGEITASADPTGVTEQQLRTRFSEFTGVMSQTAPLYSAAKKNGQKGYEAARKGRGDTFAPPVKNVEIKELRLEAFLNPDAFFSCRVSRGTYIRSLASDIGDKIGTPITLTSLRRTGCGLFSIRGAMTIPQLKKITRDDITRQLNQNLEQAEAKIRR